MIAEKSPLRLIPLAIDPKQRMALEAIVFASDIMKLAFDRLAAAGQVLLARGRSDLHPLEEASVLGDAWSVIDQIYSIRQLLGVAFPEQAPPALADWLETSSPAAAMRNGMDHVATRLTNAVEMQRTGDRMFGQLTFSDSSASDENNLRIKAVSVGAGSMPRRTSTKMFGYTHGEPVPLRSIIFEAWDQELNLGKCGHELMLALKAFEPELTRKVEEHLLTIEDPELRNKVSETIGRHQTLWFDLTMTPVDGDPETETPEA